MKRRAGVLCFTACRFAPMGRLFFSEAAAFFLPEIRSASRVTDMLINLK
jgi:hypothetical protein